MWTYCKLSWTFFKFPNMFWILDFLKNHEHFLFPENLFEIVIVFILKSWSFYDFPNVFLVHKQFMIFQDFFWNIVLLEITNKFKEEKTKTEMRTWKAKNEIENRGVATCKWAGPLPCVGGVDALAREKKVGRLGIEPGLCSGDVQRWPLRSAYLHVI